ncbi:MAG: hypothetical protein K8S23_11465 [Candidatus Cloacimonetes bacterium]|nr:hypothetical protein [Candidatus Cloacimonadota bacterium]
MKFMILLLLSFSFLSAIEVEIKNGRKIEGEIIEIAETEVFLVDGQNLYIIQKEFISNPKEYKDLNYLEKKKRRVNFNSYKIIRN